MGKHWKCCKCGKIVVPSQSELLQWEKIGNGKVTNWVKLALWSQSEPLWWEKIGKFVNWVKLAVPSHSEQLWWENIGKVVNWVKLAVSITKSHVDLKSNFLISGGQGVCGVLDTLSITKMLR